MRYAITGVCLVGATLSASLAHAQTAPQLPEVTVRPAPDIDTMARSPAAVGLVQVLDVEGQHPLARHTDELLVEQGWATWDAGNSLGLASGLNVRGFAASNQGSSQLQASRLFLNGHSDIAWRFARDPATVSRVELVTGHDATLLGAGSPAASIHYITKTPEGEPGLNASALMGSNGNRRMVLDGEWHWGHIQTRAVLAVQRGDQRVEGVADERDVLLLSNRLPLGSASLQLDLETHRSRLPFPFGTAYARGQFWWDTHYVDPRAAANRQYHRQALSWRQPLSDHVKLTAYGQHVSSTRQETLLGFFDPNSQGQLRGYYRLLDETNRQLDAGLRLEGSAPWAGAQHEWTAALQTLAMDRDFAGPQNIGGFTLDLEQPVFPTDLSTLPLSPRYALEHYRERALALADVARWGRWSLSAGLRRALMRLDSTTTAGTTPRRAADAGHTSMTWGVGHQLSDTQRIWLKRTESFQPNRGRLSGGAFLPPSEGRQWEAGWQTGTLRHGWTLALFDLTQSHLPGRDPNDPDALRLIGSSRARGLAVSVALPMGSTHWKATLNHQHARVQVPVNATQGRWLVGVPATYGAVRVSHSVSTATQAWANLQLAASRPGDDQASFRAPGYGVVNLGLEQRLSGGTTLGLGVNNLADRRYVRALTGADNVWQGQRRTWVLWLSTGRG